MPPLGRRFKFLPVANEESTSRRVEVVAVTRSLGASLRTSTFAAIDAGAGRRREPNRVRLTSVTPLVALVGQGTAASPRAQPSCHGQLDDCTARMRRKSNRATSTWDTALLLLSDM